MSRTAALLAAAWLLSAAPVSAQNPLRGFSRVSRPPMVRTILQPPLIVPSAIAEYEAINTQLGTSKAFR